MAESWKGAPKDPEDIADYAVDWSAELGILTIVSATWSVTTGDVTIVDHAETDTVSTVRLSGGTVAASPATLNNHIVLSDGQERDADNLLYLKERVNK